MKNNSIASLTSIPPTRCTVSAIFIILSVVTAFAAFGVPLDTKWTYQGQLQRNGAAYNGTCDFQFSLWDALSAGTQEGSTRVISGVNVVNGLFTVTLDFGIENTAFFTGDARWLGTSVQCSGDGGLTPLDPRQPITAAPYALSLRPGAQITGIGFTSPGAPGVLNVQNTESGIGLLGSSRDGYGVSGLSQGGPDSAGVYGENANTGAAIRGISLGDGSAVHGKTLGSGPAIYGETLGSGYAGLFIGPVNISGQLSADGVFSVRTGNSNSGVVGAATGQDSNGVFGRAEGPLSAGVFGYNTDSAAIWGRSDGAGPAIYGENSSGGSAGQFVGPVLVQGNLIVQGTVSKLGGSFKIDHPLDPANKFLSHSFVESPDMKNIYDGNVTTDATGSATVTLPDYFEALNRDFRYQLTVLGQFAQAIIFREIAGSSFEIHTDKPGVKVSWQVTGIRQDAYARENPIVVEEAKPAEQQGMYLYPAGFGAGEEKRLGPARPATAPGQKGVPAAASGDQASSK